VIEMATQSTADRLWSDPVHVAALGWALTITLSVLYALCWLATLAAADLPLAHGWLSVFSTAEPGSARSLIDGIVGSVVLAWASALLFGPTYNRLSPR
jgi:hypothetical protein